MLNLFIRKNTGNNYPEVVDALSKNGSSVEILIDTIDMSDIKRVSDRLYTLSGRDYMISDENNLLNSKEDRKLHIVAVKNNEYNSNNAMLIYSGVIDENVSPDFCMLFYIDKGNLNYKICSHTENDSKIMDVVGETESDYVIAVTSAVFVFDSMKKLDDLNRFMFNDRYYEYLTDPETISLLSTENISEELQGKTVVLNSVVGYGDFDENSYNTSDYLMNEFKTM